MKTSTLSIIGLFCATFIALPSFAECEVATLTVLSCKALKAPGDNKILAQMADKIEICMKGNDASLAFEINGKTTGISPVDVSHRTGTVVYTLKENDSIRFVVGARQQRALLMAPLGDSQAHATFKCVRTREI